MISEMFDFSRESGIKDTLYQRISAEFGLQRQEGREPLSLSGLESEAGITPVGQSAPTAGRDPKERSRER